ncbi:unnamed protein product [Kuraishia capsulata CBS 1993]|uniref:DUF300 domain protein n=1 Tax=Kuraishia capsulata CBS 1993 TaxID=1382522 RepID=W6MWV7_9ASCO|nr:uncharacterized protein KUCA_T00003915001 [Kuraishia capsulata CBS 1993]CDK27935.1 unnamed protein product [Kuraishia capsulata CBS 1993]
MSLLLPTWVIIICGISSMVSVLLSVYTISSHLRNYRKPFEQRLTVRILVVVPLFAISCFLNITSETLSKAVEPIREVYEAFVIYTFFGLLTRMLGGERRIVITASGREPVAHPSFVGWVLAPLDISDPRSFLVLKRGILQYVWIKPILCVIIGVAQITGYYDTNDTSPFGVYVWVTLVYNLSVSISLYCLAMFWKCLYTDLKPFGPWGKFLCVKMIIFASYWQGIVLAILGRAGVMKDSATAVQNALLCVEMVPFALGHRYSFPYTAFGIRSMPDCARMQTWYAFKDWISPGDLVHDFRKTLDGNQYGYRDFDSIEAVIAHPQSRSRINRIGQGMRYSEGGAKKYWLPQAVPDGDSRRFSFASSKASLRPLYPDSIASLEEEPDERDPELAPDQLARDEKLYRYARSHLPYGDSHYRVVVDKDAYLHSRNFTEQRRLAHERQTLRGGGGAGEASYGSV